MKDPFFRDIGTVLCLDVQGLSFTGIYHIMLRGINQQQIFEDKEDNEKLIEISCVGNKYVKILQSFNS